MLQKRKSSGIVHLIAEKFLCVKFYQGARVHLHITKTLQSDIHLHVKIYIPTIYLIFIFLQFIFIPAIYLPLSSYRNLLRAGFSPFGPNQTNQVPHMEILCWGRKKVTHSITLHAVIHRLVWQTELLLGSPAPGSSQTKISATRSG